MELVEWKRTEYLTLLYKGLLTQELYLTLFIL